jgi:hypothetical protein
VGPLPLPVTGMTTTSGGVTISGTVAVRDVDNPARAPIQLTLCKSVAFGGANRPSCSDDPGSIEVPATQQLVIEYVSGECLASLDFHGRLSP